MNPLVPFLLALSLLAPSPAAEPPAYDVIIRTGIPAAIAAGATRGPDGHLAHRHTEAG